MTHDIHYTALLDSPVGELTVVATDLGVRAILWEDERAGRVRLPDLEARSDHPVVATTVAQLVEYFAGIRTMFDLPTDLRGTDFQKASWLALTAIPYGSTATYGEVARRLGRPSAARAVGAATGRNPLSIVVPCHRVMGSDGSLTGFAGGLETKRWLLHHEDARSV